MRPHCILFIFLSLTLFGQNKTVSDMKLDSIKKYHIIYTMLTKTSSSTDFYYSKVNGRPASGVFIDFKVGTEGPVKNIGRRGKSLAKAVKDDPEASEELRKAYKVHLRRKRIYNTLEYFGYAMAAGSAVMLFIGIDNYDTDGITPLLIAGGAAIIAGIVDIIGFHNLTDHKMDDFSASVVKSIQIYNGNLLKNVN